MEIWIGKNGETHFPSEEEIAQVKAQWMKVVTGFFIASLVLGPGIMWLLAMLYPGFSPSYVGAFVIVNSITTALMIWWRFLITGGDAMGVAALVFTGVTLVLAFCLLLAAEWLVGLVFTGFAMPFFWPLVGLFPFLVNWKNAAALGIV